jgi:hypothetical protein
MTEAFGPRIRVFSAGRAAAYKALCCIRQAPMLYSGRLETRTRRGRVMIYVVAEPRSEPIHLASARVARPDGRQRHGPGRRDLGDPERRCALRREIYRPALLSTYGARAQPRLLAGPLHRAPGRADRRDRLRQISRYGRRLQTLYDASVSRSRRGPGQHRSQVAAGADPAGLRRALADAARRRLQRRPHRLYRRLRDRRLAGGSLRHPAELKLWLRVRLATLFEHREAIIVGTIVAELPRSLNDALLDPLMLGRRIG